MPTLFNLHRTAELHPSGFGVSPVGSSRALLHHAQDLPSPEPRWSTGQPFLASGFPYREIGGCIAAYLMQHKTPSTETPSKCHLSPTKSWGPTLPRPLRDFADRETKRQVPLVAKTPKRRTPICGI
jgi:hypothetical protein